MSDINIKLKTALMSSAPNNIYMTTMAILSRNTR